MAMNHLGSLCRIFQKKPTLKFNFTLKNMWASSSNFKLTFRLKSHWALVNMFALFTWQLGLCTQNYDADNVEDDLDDDGDGEDDLDDDGDGERREQQKECATGRD